MLKNCKYQNLDCLISDDSLHRKDGDLFGCRGCDDFMRLEYLAACKITDDISSACRIIPHIPSNLYPALFHATAQKQFKNWIENKNQNSGAAVTLSLLPLVKNWPHQVMIVRELMGPLRIPSFLKNIKHLDIDHRRSGVTEFCIDFSRILLKYFLESDLKEEQCKLSKLDLSGCCDPERSGFGLPLLEKIMKESYDPNKQPGYVKRELVLDTSCIDNSAFMKSLEVMCTHNLYHGVGLVVKFRRVILSVSSDKYLHSIIDLLAKNNATEYLEFEASTLTDYALNKLSLLSRTLIGLSLSLSRGFNSYSFLGALPKLSQLDLSSIRLRGKMNILNNVVGELKFLRLMGCGLHHGDLDVLRSSPHVNSLLEIDLSNNDFSYEDALDSLGNLCTVLSELLILELEDCNLGWVSESQLENLVKVLCNMPHLRLLNLKNADFSSRIALKCLPLLAESSSLRCICLTVPSDNYLSDDFRDIEAQIKTMQSNFKERLDLFSNSAMRVEWNENAKYSHWYYVV